MDEQAEQRIRGYLEPGEELLWAGRQEGPPEGTNRLQIAALFGAMLSIVVQMRDWAAGFGAPFVAALLIGAAFAAPFLLVGAYGAFSADVRAIYGLTDRRVVVVEGPKTPRKRMLPLESLHEIQLEIFPGGKGTISCICGEQSWPFHDEDGYPVAGPMFISIRNPLDVRDLLLETRRARVATLPDPGESPDYREDSMFDLTR